MQIIGISFNLILIRVAWYTSTANKDSWNPGQHTESDTQFLQPAHHVELATLNGATPPSDVGIQGSHSVAEA
jgi:hypothetical protein